MAETTEQLVSFLKNYLDKCIAYDVSWSKALRQGCYEYLGNKEGKVPGGDSYCKVREEVWQYQRDHNVSGIVWEEIFYRGESVRIPHVHDQLISIPGDKEVLIAARPEILDWWATATKGMELWKLSKSEEHEPIHLEEILASTPSAEWAKVYFCDSPLNVANMKKRQICSKVIFELKLELCWGIPENVIYIGSYPKSGSQWFSATRQDIKRSEFGDIFSKKS